MYSQEINDVLKALGISIGDRVRVGDKEGTLMPRPETGDARCIVLKLDNGYNIGVQHGEGMRVEKLSDKQELEKFPSKEVAFNRDKPTVAVLSTGGTIAARVDYRTGGVIPAFSAKDLVSAVPELADVANIRGKAILNIFSENMCPEHYKLIAGAVAEQIEEGAEGVVVLHGTDTMHHTSAALSFMLQDLPVPVVLVGSQRSSDRGSSDAAMNLVCGVNFAAHADYSGVVVCMHGTLDDKECHVHLGTRVRKMHTSRRDAFRSIDVLPVAKVEYLGGKIAFSGEHPGRKQSRLNVASALESKVGLVKVFPGMTGDQIAYFRENEYKGLVVEGTGLGHMPISGDDGGEGKNVAEQLVKLVESGCIVVMTSQCIYGDTNMNVYSTGRDLQKKGVFSGKGMLPEVAYLKLSWLIGNYGVDKARDMVGSNLAGEIVEKREVEEDFEKGE